MEELQLTRLWMGGVVLMMLVFGAFAVTGYMMYRSRNRKR
jgi:hypothetical protein